MFLTVFKIMTYLKLIFFFVNIGISASLILTSIIPELSCNTRNTYRMIRRYTVYSAYNGSAYRELLVIRNWFSFPDLYPSLCYVKNMDIADSVVRNYRLEGTHFPVPMLINQWKFRPLYGNPLLVKFSPRHLIAR